MHRDQYRHPHHLPQRGIKLSLTCKVGVCEKQVHYQRTCQKYYFPNRIKCNGPLSMRDRTIWWMTRFGVVDIAGQPSTARIVPAVIFLENLLHFFRAQCAVLVAIFRIVGGGKLLPLNFTGSERDGHGSYTFKTRRFVKSSVVSWKVYIFSKRLRKHEANSFKGRFTQNITSIKEESVFYENAFISPKILISIIFYCDP